MKLRKKTKHYYKINVLIYSLVFLWFIYETIKGTEYFWIFSILMGLVVVYWVWKWWKEWKRKI